MSSSIIDDLYSDAIRCSHLRIFVGHGRQAAGPTIPTRQRSWSPSDSYELPARGWPCPVAKKWVWVKIRYPNNWMVNTKLDEHLWFPRSSILTHIQMDPIWIRKNRPLLHLGRRELHWLHGLRRDPMKPWRKHAAGVGFSSHFPHLSTSIMENV